MMRALSALHAAVWILCHHVYAESSPQAVLDDSVASVHLEGCDISAVVRAPDLAPNMQTPGEARLVVKGRIDDPECKVVEWGVGLRLTESIYVRTMKNNTEAESQPEGWGAMTKLIRYFDGEGFMRKLPGHLNDQGNALTELLEYQAEERTLFDTYVQLESSESGIKHPQSRTFIIATPNTNFPPAIARDMPSHGKHSDFVKFYIKEAMKFYTSIKLANGSMIERPAGYVAFQPVFVRPPSSLESVLIPLKLSESHIKICEACSKTNGTCHQMCNTEGSELFGTPECEKALTANVAEFSVQLALPQERTFIQGQSYNLSAVIRRKSHGSSEIASALDTNFVVVRNYTDTGRQFVGTSNETVRSRMYKTQLRAQPLHVRTSGRHKASRHPLFRNLHSSVDVPLSTDDTISTLLNVTLDSDVFPTFKGVYVTPIYNLRILLSTTFSCDVPSNTLTEDLEEMSWSERPPNAKQGRHYRPRHAAMMYHTATIPITILSSSLFDAHPSSPPIHYLDPRAEGPVLYVDSHQPKFSTLLPHIRTIDSEESKILFITVDKGRHMFPHPDPHTGQIWEAKLAIERALEQGLDMDAGFE